MLKITVKEIQRSCKWITVCSNLFNDDNFDKNNSKGVVSGDRFVNRVSAALCDQGANVMIELIRLN
jgi:hypothetical protein